MGRALHAAGPASGRSGERSKNKIGQPRTKRKKRKKDLEELHQNVLEAKRNTRYGATQQKSKGKTNFTKVLNNFADRRHDNVDVSEFFEDGKFKRIKPKKICDRLLPKPMVGMFENGAKGRETHRAIERINETNVARLRGNVLKLLKGEETNPKSSWEQEENEKKKKKIENPDRPSDDSSDSNESDCEPVIRHVVKDDKFLKKKMGVKRLNREKMRITKGQDETRTEAKDQLTELPRQRDEDKCKRRLFEPDEDKPEAKNSFGIIDRTMITDHEIRFSPYKKKNDGNDGESKIIDDNVGTRMIENTGRTKSNDDNSGTSLIHEGEKIGDNFWGWSPVTCYERLCAMICIDNFEKNLHHVQTRTDPVVKIQNILQGLYTKNCQISRQKPITSLLNKSRDTRATVAWKSISTSTGDDEIYQACTQDSDMEQDSSTDSSITMIGSWHRKKFPQNRSNDDDTSLIEDKNSATPRTEFKGTRNNQRIKRNDESPVNNDDNISSADTVEKTINSVKKFLKGFKKPLNQRGTNRDVKSLVINTDTPPPRAPKIADNPRCAPRRNVKHVPTILRRTSGHSGSTESMDHEDKSHRVFQSNAEQRVIKQQNSKDQENSIFPSSRHNSPISAVMKIPTIDEINNISPCASSIFQGPNYHQHRSNNRQNVRNICNPQQQQAARANVRKTKLNCTLGRYKGIERQSSSEELPVQASQDNDYEESLSDRNIEITSRAFVKSVNMDHNARKNREFCENQEKIMDYQMECLMQQRMAENGDEIFGKKVTFRDDRESIDTHNAGFIQKKQDYKARTKARKTLSNQPRNLPQQDNSQDFKRFPSFEFPIPEINLPYGANNLEESVEKNFSQRNPPEDSMLPLCGKNTVETSSMGLVNEYYADKPLSRSFTVENIGSNVCTYGESRISKQSITNHDDSRSLKNFQRTYETARSTEQFNRGHVPVEQHRGIMKKSVVVFRPIEDTRQKNILQSEIRDSVNHDNTETMAMRETVKNLRVMAFDDNIERVSSQRSQKHFNYQQSQQQNIFSPSHWERRCTDNPSSQLIVRNFDSYAQPTKFLACEQTNGLNPRRIPIYGKSNITNGVIERQNNKRDSGEFLRLIDDKNEGNDALYLRSVDLAGSSKNQKIDGRMDNQQRGNAIFSDRLNYGYNDDSAIIVRSTTDIGTTGQQYSHQAAALMVPLSSSHYHQRTSNVPGSNLTPVRRLDSTCNEMPAGRIVYDRTNRERLSRALQLRSYGTVIREPVTTTSVVREPVTITREHQQQQQHKNQHPHQQHQQQKRYEMNVDFGVGEFRETGNMAERIQLPDGRIGILLAENSNIGNHSQHFDDKVCRSAILPNRINGQNSNVETRCLYELANNDEIVYSQPDYRWNKDYNANQPYHRLTRGNAVPDTFTGI